jgi:ATP-dependent Clp protease ATP-binding subunit ClpC
MSSITTRSTIHDSSSYESLDEQGNLKDFVVPDEPDSTGLRSRKLKKRNIDQAEIGDNHVKKVMCNLTIIGRDHEMHRMVRMLSQPTPQRPLLVGLAGVGKRAIVSKLARFLSSERCPEMLRNREIVCVNSKELLGKALANEGGEGEAKLFRDKIRKIESKTENPIIFFQDIDTLITDEGSIGNVFQAFLQKSSAIIGSISGTANLENASTILIQHNFQLINVKEPTPQETEQIIEEYLKSDQNPKHAEVSSDALKLAIKLSSTYIKSQPFPVKAIRLIGEAISEATLQAESELIKVNAQDIAQIMEEKTGISADQLCKTELATLQRIHTSMHEKLIGQDYAIETLYRSVKRSKAGFRDFNKPLGVFLLVGPTGVGKTELAKILAHVMQCNFLRFDMGEYQEAHSLARLIGSPPGYLGHEAGGGLTNELRKNPHSVVLLDEIEKAHTDVANALLQVFDDGRITDGRGVTVDCTEAFFIMTSNLGAQAIFEKSSQSDSIEHLLELIIPLVEARWSPEFLGRITAVVPFKSLSESDYPQVVEVLFKRLSNEILSKNGISVEWKPALVQFFIQKYTQDMRSGIRGLCERVKTEVYDILADAKLSGRFDAHMCAVIDQKKGKLVVIPKIVRRYELIN